MLFYCMTWMAAQERAMGRSVQRSASSILQALYIHDTSAVICKFEKEQCSS